MSFKQMQNRCEDMRRGLPSSLGCSSEKFKPTHLLMETFSDIPKEIRIMWYGRNAIGWISRDGAGSTQKIFIRWVEEL